MRRDLPAMLRIALQAGRRRIPIPADRRRDRDASHMK